MIVQYIISGGPVMIPIAIASVIGVAAFLERLWSLRRSRIVPRGHVVELVELARQGRFTDAQALCRKRDTAVSRIADIALELRGAPRATIKERLEEIGRREAADLERFLGVIGTVASLGPLLGLLGTVGGMILTFQGVQAAGTGDVHALAGGIAQALVTTFAGLCVAIPAVIAHRYLTSRVDSLLVDLEEASLVLLELVSAEGLDRAAQDAAARGQMS